MLRAHHARSFRVRPRPPSARAIPPGPALTHRPARLEGLEGIDGTDPGGTYLPIRHEVSVFAMRDNLEIPPDPWDVPRFRLARCEDEAKSTQQ
jgi:hypothetical protein